MTESSDLSPEIRQALEQQAEELADVLNIVQTRSSVLSCIRNALVTAYQQGAASERLEVSKQPTDRELEHILPAMTLEQRIETVICKYVGGATSSAYDGETPASKADPKIAKYLVRKLRKWLPPDDQHWAAEERRQMQGSVRNGSTGRED